MNVQDLLKNPQLFAVKKTAYCKSLTALPATKSHLLGLIFSTVTVLSVVTNPIAIGAVSIKHGPNMQTGRQSCRSQSLSLKVNINDKFQPIRKDKCPR